MLPYYVVRYALTHLIAYIYNINVFIITVLLMHKFKTTVITIKYIVFNLNQYLLTGLETQNLVPCVELRANPNLLLNGSRMGRKCLWRNLTYQLMNQKVKYKLTLTSLRYLYKFAELSVCFL